MTEMAVNRPMARRVNNPKRNEIQSEIDKLLGQETDYAMYSA